MADDADDKSVHGIDVDLVYDEALGMNVHPAANMFAMLEPDEFSSLKTSISKLGLMEPVVLWQGAILDGRNRWKACQELGIEARTVEWTAAGDVSPEAFVVAQNIMRRHLNISQRAAHAARLYAQYMDRQSQMADDPPSRESHFLDPFAPKSLDSEPSDQPAMPATDKRPFRDQLAENVGISAPYVGDAYSLLRADPVLFARVESGELSLNRALDKFCDRAHKSGKLFEDNLLRPGIKKKWLQRQERAAEKVAAPTKPPARASRLSAKDFREEVSPQKVASILKKERKKLGLRRSIVPVTFEVIFANPEAFEEVHALLLKHARVLRVNAKSHLSEEDSTVTGHEPTRDRT